MHLLKCTCCVEGMLPPHVWEVTHAKTQWNIIEMQKSEWKVRILPKKQNVWYARCRGFGTSIVEAQKALAWRDNSLEGSVWLTCECFWPVRPSEFVSYCRIALSRYFERKSRVFVLLTNNEEASLSSFVFLLACYLYLASAFDMVRPSYYSNSVLAGTK